MARLVAVTRDGPDITANFVPPRAAHVCCSTDTRHCLRCLLKWRYPPTLRGWHFCR